MRKAPAIVSPKSQKELKLLRQGAAARADVDDPEVAARVRAFIKRMTPPPESEPVVPDTRKCRKR